MRVSNWPWFLENIIDDEQKLNEKIKGKIKLDLNNEDDLKKFQEEANSSGQISKLSNRSMIQIKGKDINEFLQNIMSADISQFAKNDKLRWIYGLWLNPKGRIVTDLFVVKPFTPSNRGDTLEYWIDVSTSLEYISYFT